MNTTSDHTSRVVPPGPGTQPPATWIERRTYRAEQQLRLGVTLPPPHRGVQSWPAWSKSWLRRGIWRRGAPAHRASTRGTVEVHSATTSAPSIGESSSHDVRGGGGCTVRCAAGGAAGRRIGVGPSRVGHAPGNDARSCAVGGVPLGCVIALLACESLPGAVARWRRPAS